MAQGNTGAPRFQRRCLLSPLNHLRYAARLARMTEEETVPTTLRPKYRWPFIAGAMVLLWLVLAVMWTIRNVEQTVNQGRDRNETNATQDADR